MKRDKPIFNELGWICPKCNWQNPQLTTVIDTYPATYCYKCKNCNFHYDERRALTKAELFRMNYPNGKKQQKVTQ